MRNQLTPKLKVGKLLYIAAEIVQNGKDKLEVQTYAIRSIMKKKGSQTKYGYKQHWADMYPEKFVHATARLHPETIDKKGEWNKSISGQWKLVFLVTSERLPNGFYTTKRAALEYFIATEKKYLVGLGDDLLEANNNGDQDWTDDTTDSISVTKRMIISAKRQLTKMKKTK